MAIVEVRIRGGSELYEKLEKLPVQVGKKIIRSGLKAAAGIWRQEMKERVPVGPSRLGVGYLHSHIGMKTSVRGDELQGRCQVGPVRKGFWSLFLEFGTVRMPAQPFIRQAFETKKDQVLAKFVDVCKEKLREIGMRD